MSRCQSVGGSVGPASRSVGLVFRCSLTLIKLAYLLTSVKTLQYVNRQTGNTDVLVAVQYYYECDCLVCRLTVFRGMRITPRTHSEQSFWH